MSFSVSFTAKSKGEALTLLENAELPQSVRGFLAAAIHGFNEPGPAVAKAIEGTDKVEHVAGKPATIVVSASGHLDAAGGTSTLSVNVSAG